MEGMGMGYEVMFVDDGSSGVYRSAKGMPYRATTGDRLVIPAGPLAYTYGAYKIEPLQEPTVEAEQHNLQPLPKTPADVLSVMTWNTENFFDDQEPNPTDPPMPTPQQYHVSVQKVANTIADAGFPLVVGLEEVENIRVLDDVAATDVLEPWHYKAVLIEGHDSRGIDVGFLIRTDRAEILDVKQYDAPEGLTPRPPLVVHLRVQGGSAPFEVYAIVKAHVLQANADLPPAARIRRFLLLHKELDADDAELTRTRKVRRRLIAKRYDDQISALYSEATSVPVETTITYQDGRTATIRTNLRIEDVDISDTAGK
jgi:hypothetical protein